MATHREVSNALVTSPAQALPPSRASRVDLLVQLLGELTEEDVAEVDVAINVAERQLLALDIVRGMLRTRPTEVHVATPLTLACTEPIATTEEEVEEPSVRYGEPVTPSCEKGEPPPAAVDDKEVKLMDARVRIVVFLEHLGRPARSSEIIRGAKVGPSVINKALDYLWFKQTPQGIVMTSEAKQAVLPV